MRLNLFILILLFIQLTISVFAYVEDPADLANLAFCEDCNGTTKNSCIEEGEELSLYLEKGEKLFACCEGLSEIDAVTYDPEWDYSNINFEIKYCTYCGDGACEEPENVLNCEKDCMIGKDCMPGYLNELNQYCSSDFKWTDKEDAGFECKLTVECKDELICGLEKGICRELTLAEKAQDKSIPILYKIYYYLKNLLKL